MNNTLNRINDAYVKRLEQLYRDRSNMVNGAVLPIFIESLKYTRDVCIVTQKPAEVVATLTTAIDEFETYNKTKKELHWNNFSELIRLNMKEWLVANDSV